MEASAEARLLRPDWHLSQHLTCVASEPNGVEHHNVMKPLSWDNKQLGLVSPLESAASQSGQTNNPSMNKDEARMRSGRMQVTTRASS
jgi:hypothetical protein